MSELDESLETLYRQNRRELYTYALSVTRCTHRAEDAVQEAFRRLFRLRAAPDNLKAYVFRAVRNAAIDQRRKGAAGREEPLDDFIFDPGANPREEAESREFRRAVAIGLLELSEDERETIVQRLYSGLTFREIAETRDMPQGTVSALYYRGLAKLKDRLEEPT